MTTKTDWEEIKVDPRKIILDPQNPRVDVGPNVTQDQLRLKLLELEDVLELARSIESSGGLFFGERLITTVENGKHVVLEGNRRVAACQMLLDPSLIPTNYKTRYPALSTATRVRILKLACDVSPNRSAAEHILTKRHTERGAKPWSPVAKMRRAVRLLENASVDEVAKILGTSSSQVKKLIRPYKLLRYALSLNIWTPDERLRLENEKLITTPYTRFFTLKGTQRILQIHFDEDQNIVSELPAPIFKEQMSRVARDFLLPDPANQGRPKQNTRTAPEDYFATFAGSAHGTKPTSGLDRSSIKPNTGTSTYTKPTTPKASIFFENLQCHVQENNLIKLTDEIKTINHNRMPIAASMLTRSIFECALVYQLRKTKKFRELILSEGKDPGLAALVKFCGNVNNGVFAEANICKTLRGETTRQARVYLDGMVHLKFQEADPPTLESVANNLRQIIQYILTDQ